MEEINSSDNKLINYNHISKGSGKSRIIVIPTSVVTTGQIITDPSGKSLEPTAMFVRNSLDYLNGNENFCAMRSKVFDINTLKETSSFRKNLFLWMGFIIIPLIFVSVWFVCFLFKKNHRNQIFARYNKIADNGESNNE